MDIIEAKKKLAGNPELRDTLEEALGRNAGEAEITAILADAGVDAETAEALVAECQKSRGEAIAEEELDDDELDQAAGGGTGNDCTQAEDCDFHFKSANYWNRDRCQTFEYCDETFSCFENRSH